MTALILALCLTLGAGPQLGPDETMADFHAVCGEPDQNEYTGGPY